MRNNNPEHPRKYYWLSVCVYVTVDCDQLYPTRNHIVLQIFSRSVNYQYSPCMFNEIGKTREKELFTISHILRRQLPTRYFQKMVSTPSLPALIWYLTSDTKARSSLYLRKSLFLWNRTLSKFMTKYFDVELIKYLLNKVESNMRYIRISDYYIERVRYHNPRGRI